MSAGDSPPPTSAPEDQGDPLALVDGPDFEASLDDAAARLERALGALRAGAGGLSFDAAGPDPERNLFADFSALGDPALSFAAAPDEEGDGAGGKVARFLEQMTDRLGATARLETRRDGEVVAATTVGLGGDFASAVGGAASAADLAGHLAALEQTLRGRRARARIVLCTLQAAAKIAVAAGTGNPLLAVGAAWKVVRGVMAEWEEHK